MRRVAQLPVLPLVDDLKNPFYLSVIHGAVWMEIRAARQTQSTLPPRHLSELISKWFPKIRASLLRPKLPMGLPIDILEAQSLDLRRRGKIAELFQESKNG